MAIEFDGRLVFDVVALGLSIAGVISAWLKDKRLRDIGHNSLALARGLKETMACFDAGRTDEAQGHVKELQRFAHALWKCVTQCPLNEDR